MIEVIDSLLAPDIFLQSNGDEDWHIMAITGVMALLASAGITKQAYDKYRKSRAVRNRATEPVRSVAMGTSELKGRAKPYGELHPQPFQEGECVRADYTVEEMVSKETDDGEQTSEWETVRSGTVGDHVVLEDDTGAIVLDDPPVNYSRSARTRNTEGRISNLLEGTFFERWFDFSPNEATQRFLNEEVGLPVDSDNRRRYTQRVLTEDKDLYVLGEATHHDGRFDEEVLDELEERHGSFQDDYTVERDSASGDYIVSDKDESQLIRRYYLYGLVWLAIGVVVFVFALFALASAVIEAGV